ncbi:MAG: mechanosensitive ion channel family protein [Gammaproteobacteria bacterium]|nr:mechanosensitive ion channel family protein [Gammaproteobacteria bacterium]NNC98431.1 mechanosensitive ion channel family protein [Gammaproteobacteria bacterium]NNM14738.1 mechanosensitive ion channel family protein [Gammaproteobacteria bacterium]
MQEFLNSLNEKFGGMLPANDVMFGYATKGLIAIFILFIGWLLSHWAKRLVKAALAKADDSAIDATVKPLLGKITRALVMVIAVLVALSYVGIPISSLIAILAAAGLAIGLALQGTLSNIAAGIMLLFLRPLRVGEFIETSGATGTVVEVGIFTTILKTVDGLFVSAPNAQIWGSRIQNFDRYDVRRATVNIGVSYDTNLDKARELLFKVMREQENMTTEPGEPEVFVDEFADSSINFTARCWFPREQWRANATELRIAVKKAFDDAGIEIPFPQRVIHSVSE